MRDYKVDKIIELNLSIHPSTHPPTHLSIYQQLLIKFIELLLLKYYLSSSVVGVMGDTRETKDNSVNLRRFIEC